MAVNRRNLNAIKGLACSGVHHSIAVFDSVEDVLRWCDPHREHIWEEDSDADETKLLISRDYKEGTGAWRT